MQLDTDTGGNEEHLTGEKMKPGQKCTDDQPGEPQSDSTLS